jgi:hypothetical protein
VGHKRLLLGQFQLELVAQELSEVALYLLGFGLWPGETEQGVVDLCRGPDYAEDRWAGSHVSWWEGIRRGGSSA